MPERNTKVRRRLAAGKFRLRIRDLRNLGPRAERLLADIGIHTAEELRRRGALEAYLAIGRAGAATSLNLLWSLVGALEPWPEGRDWREVAASEARLPLLLAVETRESARRATLQAAGLAVGGSGRRAVEKSGARARTPQEAPADDGVRAPWVPGMPFEAERPAAGRRGRRRVRPAS